VIVNRPVIIQSNVDFAKKSDVQGSTGIPATVNFIRTVGYGVQGDKGGGLYKRSASEPSHPGKIQDASNAWWELAENVITPQMFGMTTDGEDIYEAFHDMVEFVNARGGGYVVFPPGTYTMSSNTLNSSGKSAPLWDECDGLTIEGYGAKIDLVGSFQRTTTLDRVIMPFQLFDCKRVRIAGFEVDGNVDQMTRSPSNLAEVSVGLVSLHGCEQVELENLWLHHCQTDGIALRDSDEAPCRNITTRNVRCLNNARQGISIIQCVGYRDFGSKFSDTGDTGGTYGAHSPGCGVDIEPNDWCVPWVSGEHLIIANERAGANGKRYRITDMTNRRAASTVEPSHASGAVTGADGIEWTWIDNNGATTDDLTGDIIFAGTEFKNNSSAIVSENAGRVSTAQIAFIDCTTENTRDTDYHFILGLPNCLVHGGNHDFGAGLVIPSGTGGIGAHVTLRDCIMRGTGTGSIRCLYEDNDLTIDNVQLICERTTALTGTPYWPGIVEAPYRQDKHQIRNLRVFVPDAAYGGSGSGYQIAVFNHTDLLDPIFKTDLAIATTEHFYTTLASTTQVRNARYFGASAGAANSFRPGNASAYDTTYPYTIRTDGLTGSKAFNPASLDDGVGETTTVTVTGAALGDFALASFSLDTSGITITAWVSAADTVSVRLQNESGGVLNIGTGTLRARVIKAV
jgi:hypothetical protein